MLPTPLCSTSLKVWLSTKIISIAHLKGITDYFVENFYGPGRKTRLRPFHFQFTEPSFEVDINCGLCLGKRVVKTCKIRAGMSLAAPAWFTQMF